jgi:hypothetical protein
VFGFGWLTYIILKVWIFVVAMNFSLLAVMIDFVALM